MSDALQIAIDPTDSQLVYAATAWGVTVSNDGGDSWKASNQGLPEYFSKGVVIDHTVAVIISRVTDLATLYLVDGSIAVIVDRVTDLARNMFINETITVVI